MNNQFITVIDKAPFVVIKMSSPQTKNLLTIDGMREIIETIERYERDDKYTFAVLTGEDDIFCMGGNLGDRYTQTSESIMNFANLLMKLHLKIKESRLIFIAAVNGKVGGGGVSLTDACTFALASKNATFCYPESLAGLAPMMSIVGVSNTLSSKKCMELFAFGGNLSAEQALEFGLINKITDDDVIDSTIEFLTPMINNNLVAFNLCKEYYYHSRDLSDVKKLEMGKHYLVSMLKSK